MELWPYIAEWEVPAPGKVWERVPGMVTTPGLLSAKGYLPINFTVRSVMEERVKVPAGEFATVRVEAQSASIVDPNATHVLRATYWYSPQVRRPVKMSFRLISTIFTQSHEVILELASFSQSR